MLSKVAKVYGETALIKLIAVGLLIGIILALFVPVVVPVIAVFGKLFVSALKGVAPILVFVLVMNAMSQKSESNATMKPIIQLYVIGTFLASLVAVTASFLFPTKLKLQIDADTTISPPGGIIEVLQNVIMNVVDNPIHALTTANYIGILAWGVIMGLAFRHAGDELHNVLADLAKAVTKVVQWVIRFAPFGIMGLVADAIATSGVDALLGYAKLLAVLLGAFFSVALIMMNPLIVFFKLGINPYPLVFATLKESGIYAFFTRSSAANIPVNMSLCKRLGLNEDLYSISIPLGATINMAGASITIAVLSLAAAHTLGISVDMPTALLLCIISTVGACGASGVAGGSLLLRVQVSELTMI